MFVLFSVHKYPKFFGLRKIGLCFHQLQIALLNSLDIPGLNYLKKKKELHVFLHIPMSSNHYSQYCSFAVSLFSGVTFPTLFYVCCGCEYVAVAASPPSLSTLSFLNVFRLSSATFSHLPHLIFVNRIAIYYRDT